MKYIPRIILFICGFWIGVGVSAQNKSLSEIMTAENDLCQKFTELYKSSNDSEKESLNSRILDELEQLLIDPLTFKYPFDSLRWIGKIYSSDNKVRVITWNIPATNGTHTYYGFIQCGQKKGKPCLVFRLHARSQEITVPESATLGAEKWWGALYYEILVNRYKGFRIYTLIGLDLHDRYSNKKVIDVLTFEDNHNPVFGKPVFRIDGKLNNRVIFEFAEDVVMIVRYNEQKKMIVFDHLAPIDPALRNSPRFYAPDSSHDGFIFRKGIWEYVPDVDVRNP